MYYLTLAVLNPQHVLMDAYLFPIRGWGTLLRSDPLPTDNLTKRERDVCYLFGQEYAVGSTVNRDKVDFETPCVERCTCDATEDGWVNSTTHTHWWNSNLQIKHIFSLIPHRKTVFLQKVIFNSITFHVLILHYEQMMS